MKYALIARSVLLATAVSLTWSWSANAQVGEVTNSNINNGSFIPRDTQLAYRYYRNVDNSVGTQSEDLNTLLQDKPTAAGPIDDNIEGGQYIPRDTQLAYRYYRQEDNTPGTQSTDLNVLLQERPTAAGPIDSNINGGNIIPRDTQNAYRFYLTEDTAQRQGINSGR